MKKRILLAWSLVLALILLGACGKSEKAESTGGGNIITETDDTENTDTEETNTGEENTGEAEITDTAEEDASEDDTEKESGALEGEYTLQYYQHGEFLETDTLNLTASEFQIINPADGTIVQNYAYQKLTDHLISLFEAESGSYVICYYAVDGTEFTLNALGATATAIVGTYQINYLDQGSTATINFAIEGTAVEDNQVDVYGNDRSAPYEFYYCWYADDDTSMFLLICLDNGYYAYSVEMSEDGGTLYFTEVGGYTYDLD